MAKKKKAPVLEAWCWYCDREFEDEKVLLQHQRAKHYRCPQCPRKLNTAGGLSVHLHQVHKAEPDRIENTLPGRDSFDIEIYGMAGIPPQDLAEWQARKASGGGSNGNGTSSGPPPSKRPKVANVVLTPEQLKAQLEAHKALMSGGSVPAAAGAAAVPPPAFSPNMYNGPPPPFGVPVGPQYAGPPPVAGGYYPPAWAAPPPALSPHQVALRTGQKSRHVYTDKVLSPEERLAKVSKYAYRDPEDLSAPALAEVQGAQGGVPTHPYAGPPPGFHGPPPSFPPPVPSYGSPYGMQSPYQQPPPSIPPPHVFQQPPPLGGSPAYGSPIAAYGSPAPPSAPFGAPAASSPLPAQSGLQPSVPPPPIAAALSATPPPQASANGTGSPAAIVSSPAMKAGRAKASDLF